MVPNIKSNDWFICVKEARHWHTLTSVGNLTVAAGGQDPASREYWSSVEILANGKGSKWSTAAWGLQVATTSHCAVATSPSHLLVIGGRDRSR